MRCCLAGITFSSMWALSSVVGCGAASCSACTEEGESCVNSNCRADCEDDAGCADGETCVNSHCYGACANDADCADGVFCNRAETCVDNVCTPGKPPCEESECCDEILECYDPQLCGAGCGCTPQAPVFGLIVLGLVGLRFGRRRDRRRG